MALDSHLSTMPIIRPRSRMFYEDNNPTTHHVAAVSTDGVHFKVQGTLTSAGLDPDDPQPPFGGTWPMMRKQENGTRFSIGHRPLSTTGGVIGAGTIWD